jgi:hypothetical protein
VLRQLISVGPFDLIIDDGGHSDRQQQTSLEWLIPYALTPGGLFVMEDLSCSFQDTWKNGIYRDTDERTSDVLLRHLRTYMQETQAHTDFMRWVQQVACSHGQCVFVKYTQRQVDEGWAHHTPPPLLITETGKMEARVVKAKGT